LAETKERFSKILVAVDGSEQSFKAAEYAIEIAKRYSAQIVALTILDISKPKHLSSTFITAPTYGMRELEEERKEAQQWLDKMPKCHLALTLFPYLQKLILSCAQIILSSS
jgi:nucleotide-binding universal stress UspA family protein